MSAREDFDREVQEEKDVVADLAALESGFGDDSTLSGQVRALIRAYRRKHNEARELNEYLVGLKEYLTECWDEEEEYFDPAFANNSTSRTEWCPNLIEEIGEMVEEGTVYMALPIKTEA
jgi:hypothetical protein